MSQRDESHLRIAKGLGWFGCQDHRVEWPLKCLHRQGVFAPLGPLSKNGQMRLEKLEQLEEQTRAHSVFECLCWFCNVLSLCCQRYVSWYHCRESLLTLFQTFGTAWVACRHSLELALFPVGIELTKRTSMDRHASGIQDLRSLELAEEGGWFFSGTD